MYKALFFIFLLVTLAGLDAGSIQDSSLDAFLNEHLSYHMYYKGLHVADSYLNFRENDSQYFEITWHANTRSLFYLLFPIDNTYRTVWSKWTTLERFEKEIDQKNIQQNWSIHYDHANRLAVVDSNRQWKIQPYCRTLTGLIYILRLKNPDFGDSLSFIVDIESQSWELTGVTKSVSESVYLFKADREIVFTFSPETAIRERTWDTDLLTHNIGRPGAQLRIQLGPAPDNIPLLIAFENIAKPVSMQLISRTGHGL